MNNPRELFMPYIENFSVPRPIFSLTDGYGGIRASIHPRFAYQPEAIEGDPLSQIAVDKYDYRFDKHAKAFKIDKDKIAQECVSAVKPLLRRFLEKNLQMKNPRQSKLWRFLYRGRVKPMYQDDFSTGTIYLYKYIYQCTGENLNFSDKNDPNLKNALLILEAMVDKYEQE